MKAARCLIALACLAMLAAIPSADAVRISGRVIDAATRKPIAGAFVGDRITHVRSGADGAFALTTGDGGPLRARAHGYGRTEVALRDLHGAGSEIALTPIRPKALYLSVYGIGDRRLRGDALDLIAKTELNALVIDLKGDRGLIPYRSNIALASTAGAQRVITVGNLPGLLSDLHGRGIYTIARIVVFKDTLLAQGRPDLALRVRGGSMYRDRENLAWANPYSREVWEYNIAIAVEAAQAGFDEIQFDYVRLPDTTTVVYDRPWTEANRVSAIDGFLSEARKALEPYNVFLSADVFGYICWNTDDTRIGQDLDHLVEVVDYLSPMLYPSSFQFGIPGCRNPVDHPYQIVHESLDRARARTSASPLRFRPWLQAFRDYAFGGRPFTAGEVRTQIAAAEDFGSDGWMLWNPHNRYSAADLKP